MITRTFTVEQLRNWGLPTETEDVDYPAQILQDTHVGRRCWSEDRRCWSEDRRCVFRAPDDGLVYRVAYSIGLTEHQEERPWEYTNEVSGVRVMGQERTVIEWVVVKE